MSGSIIGDFFNDIGQGLGKVFDGDILDGVGNIVGGTVKGAVRTVGAVGSVIGATGKAVGDLVDGIFEDGEVSQNEISDENRVTLIVASVVAMLAKMAKADGRVTRDETQFLSSWLDVLDVDADVRQNFKQFANEQVHDESRSIYDHAEMFRVAAGDEDLAANVYLDLWRMALADGHVSEEELHILRSVPPYLGLAENVFETVCSHLTGNVESDEAQAQSLDACYQILGCSPDASDAEVKRCYKAQMSQYHPDAISSKNLAPGFVEFANQQSAKINAAYETIKSIRSMR